MTYFEKALTLIDEEWDRPRLLTDTAKVYSLLGGDIATTTDKAKSEKLFGKANSLFNEATHLDPQYANAYQAWALSLYNQRNYLKAWKMVKRSRDLGRDFDPKFIDTLDKKMPEPK